MEKKEHTHVKSEMTEAVTEAPESFCEPDDCSSSVVFEVEGQNVRVNRVIVCAYSPVFDAMLNGDFSEKNKTIIALADDCHDDFVALMRVIHPPMQLHKFTSSNIEGILHLADKYQMAGVVITCEEYLFTTAPSITSLILAQRYKLNSFFTHCSSLICKGMTLNEILSLTEEGQQHATRALVATKVELIRSRIVLFENFFKQKIFFSKYLAGGSRQDYTFISVQDVQDMIRKAHPIKNDRKSIYGNYKCPDTSTDESGRKVVNLNEPWNWDDVTVVIHDRQFHACKQVLCQNSTVLKQLVNNSKTDKQLCLEVDEGVTYNDVIALMIVIHPPVGVEAITDSNVHAVARLANKYEMRGVVDICEGRQTT